MSAFSIKAIASGGRVPSGPPGTNSARGTVGSSAFLLIYLGQLPRLSCTCIANWTSPSGPGMSPPAMRRPASFTRSRVSRSMDRADIILPPSGLIMPSSPGSLLTLLSDDFQKTSYTGSYSLSTALLMPKTPSATGLAKPLSPPQIVVHGLPSLSSVPSARSCECITRTAYGVGNPREVGFSK